MKIQLPSIRLALDLPMVLVGVIVATSQPVEARITRTKPAASFSTTPVESPTTLEALLPRFTIGSGFEIESSSDENSYDFPFLIEYNVTDKIKIGIEPDIVYSESKVKNKPSFTALNDLETPIEWEFLSERRYRPALTALGNIKWPTATHPDVGTPGVDLSLGLAISKDLVLADVTVDLFYTFATDCHVPNGHEVSLEAEWPVTYYLDVLTEVVYATGAGGVGPLGVAQSVNETEGLLGLAEHINKFLKLEQGIIRKSDQSWQFVFAWEYNFSGD